MAVEVRITERSQLDRLNALQRDPTPLMHWVGVTLRTQSERAFSEKSWDGVKWPEQYPGQDDPFIHFAGALGDLEKGPTVKRRRLKRAPPGIDTGRLSMSIEYKVVGKDEVVVGSTLPYAKTFGEGGKGSIEVTPRIRQNLYVWLKKKSNAPYRRKLGFLFSVEQMETDQLARPFIGMTKRSFDLMTRNIEVWFKKEVEGG